jgi:hypothetical protein
MAIKSYTRVLIFVVFLVNLLVGCTSAKPPLEERVAEFYDSYLVLMEAGVSGLLTLTLEKGELLGVISQPTEEDFITFYEHFTESPLCQECDVKEEIVVCIARELEERGCVKIATCPTCIYPCQLIAQ